MSHRTAIAIWFCYGIAPLLSWASSVSSNPARWLVTVAWLAGWACLWQATRDPTRQQLLACFVSTHIARLTAAFWLFIGLELAATGDARADSRRATGATPAAPLGT